MKRILIVIVMSLLAITNITYAQGSRTLVMDNVKSLQKTSGYLNHLSTKAARDFVSRYTEAVDPKWFEAKNGYIVRFKLDSLDNRAAYDKRGHWVYTIRILQELQLPKSVRHLVKSTYYDYRITQVEEIDRPNEHRAWLVHMCDSTSWINVQVSDGEMKVMEEFKRGY